MGALIYADILGVRNAWQWQGRSGAERAFRSLEALVEKVLSARPGPVISGALESDSLALLCTGLPAAVRIGTALFKEAFRTGNDREGPRMWLRGAVVPCENQTVLRADTPASSRVPKVLVSRLAGSLLDAIAAEKAGFRGMRLLAGGGFTRRQIRNAARLELAPAVAIDVLKRAPKAAYPPRLYDAHFYDVFWMACEDEYEWNDLKAIMAKRLRLALADPDELVQAGATDALFSYWGAHIKIIGRRHGLTRFGEEPANKVLQPTGFARG